MILVDYQSLVDGYNPKVPEKFQLPNNPVGEHIEVGDGEANMVVNIGDDNKIESIVITTDDDKIEGTYYKLFVDGLEDGMGWSSGNFYNAAMATLKDHQDHTGENSQGVKAAHHWENNKMIVTVTK